MADRDEAGRFLPGNRIWEACSTAGRRPLFADPEALWAACVEYFEWVAENPLLEGIAYQGALSKDGLPKMQAMTLRGLCVFLDIAHETWCNWRKTRPEFSDVIARVEDIIYHQKFTGAAAGLLNANIIARDLGLAEKTAVGGDSSAPPIQTEEVGAPVRALLQLVRGIAERNREAGEPTGE